jgi:two-component system phosphate regulon sensor histidine kinase PhoR
MFFRSIRWRIAVPHMALILATTLGLTVYVSDQVRKARLADLEAKLLSDARVVVDDIASLPIDEDNAGALDKLAQRWASLLDARVTIINSDGAVLGESHEDRAQMDNHLYRPEVQQALTVGQGTSIRYSQTVGYDMMYATFPLMIDGEAANIIRVALPLNQIDSNIGRLRQGIMTAGLLAALLSILLALLIAENTAQPVRHLTQVAERLAEGDLSARLFPTTHDEIGALTHAFNHMAEQLQEKVAILADQQSRLAAVLEYMADGVLITDDAGQVRLINPAAARLLDTSEETALGRSFAQVVRHYQLIELWNRCHEQGNEQTESVEISHQELFLQVIVTPFHESGAQGYLVILQDLSRVRRLETVRRDFISNISHELRTPLAGLKALVETLRDTAVRDPLATQHFLNRMEIEVDALTQMVQELLELSRIESGNAPLRLKPTPVADVVVAIVDRLMPQSERSGLNVSVDLPRDLPLFMADAEQVQQVITNLVHNAIKFTPTGGQVAISAEHIGNEVVISVHDTGVGIPAQDLPRIFERFYKADHARSSGGTGLGLAIAKHIVQAHGGRIWAESVEGQGATFYIAFRALTNR